MPRLFQTEWKIDHSVLLKICNTAKVSIWSFMKKTCKFPHQQKGPPNQNLHHLKTSTPKPFWDCDFGRGHVTIASFIVSQPLLVWRIQGYLVPWNPFGSLEYKNRKTYPGFLQKKMFESHSLWALALFGLSIPSTKNRVRSISHSHAVDSPGNGISQICLATQDPLSRRCFVMKPSPPTGEVTDDLDRGKKVENFNSCAKKVEPLERFHWRWVKRLWGCWENWDPFCEIFAWLVWKTNL